MNKIKAWFIKIRSTISIKTYKRPFVFIILLMVLINLLILSIAAIIAVSIDSDFSGFIDAFVNGSLKWMLTPNAILDITKPNTLLLAVTVLVIGLILFSGTIIALTTNQIKDYFNRRKSGSGKIYLSNHIVILNWNNKVPELVADLMFVEEREFTVVILAKIDKEIAEKQIMNTILSFNKKEKSLSNLKVLVKNGDPLNQQDLDDISLSQAASVIIMNIESYETITRNMSLSDLNIIKTVLKVGRNKFVNNPPIVAEIKRIETKEKINTMSEVVKTLKSHQVLPICFDRRLGQIIAQTIIHSSMEDVYLSMFSFEGSEVYYLKDVDFETCLDKNSDCIPLARHNNGVFVIGEDDRVIHNQSKHKQGYEKITSKAFEEATDLEVYILGKNNKLQFILDAFNEYEKLYHNKFSATHLEEHNIQTFIEEANQSKRPITVVLLSDETQSSQSMDANVIDNLIYLETHLKRKDVTIIAELLDPSNDAIIRDFNINNTIISNKIISLLLTKLALYEETADFYENLLTLEINEDYEDDQEVIIRKASDLFEIDFPMEFHTLKSYILSVYHAFDKRLIPFGIFKNKQLNIHTNNLHEHKHFILDKNDLLVLMKLKKKEE